MGGNTRGCWADLHDDDDCGGLLRCDAWGVSPAAFVGMHGRNLSRAECNWVFGCDSVKVSAPAVASGNQVRGGVRKPYRHWRGRACVEENAAWGKRTLPWQTRVRQAVCEEVVERRKQRLAELRVLVQGQEA